MSCVIRGASIVTLGLLASLAVAGCDKDSTPTTNMSTTSTTSAKGPLLAQYFDGGGMPNPMPGSPLGDAGISPLPPPNPGPTVNPGNPVNPGAPTYPGAPNNPGNPNSPGTPGAPGMPGNPGSPGNPGAPPLTH